MKPTGKNYSDKQEKEIAKMLGGRVQSNSGGTRFGGGDVHTDNLFVEAKVVVADKSSFTIRKDWLEKCQAQAFEQGKDNYALAFRFGPQQPDYFVIDRRLFKQLADYLKGEENV